jgi:hypothetical protein
MLKCALLERSRIRIAHCLTILTAVVLLMMALPLTTAAQTFRGTILGSVTDQTGALVVGAKVTVRNVDTSLVRTTTTANDGSYAAPELPIGNYSVTVEKEGFQTAVITGVRVEVAVERRVDASLKPGDVAQRIEVSGEGIVTVETTSNVLGGAFEGKTVLDLPINGRDYTKLLIMVPGATGEPNGGGDSPGSYGLFSVNGNRGRSNNFLLDGTDMNDGFRNLPAINQGGVFGTPGTVLPLEAIAEVRVLSNFEPEFGRNSGSVVNIVTKSGTNEFHGSAFEYFRHDHLNARNFFNNVGPKDKFRNNQFGGSLGGPLRRDRSFFYGAYEGQRERLGVTSVNTVPSDAEFAAAITVLGGNPATAISANPVVNQVIRNFFARCEQTSGCSGGTRPWPVPNLQGSPNSVSSAPAFNDADSFIIKLDHAVNEKNQVSGRYFFGESEQSFPLGTGGGNNLPGTNTFSPIRTQLISVSYVGAYTPRHVNEVRFGWNLYQQDFLAANRDVFQNPATTIGLNTGVTRERDFGLPTIDVGGFARLGSAPYSNPRGRDDTNWHFIDNFSWKLTRHDVKFGYEFRRTTIKSFYDTNFRGVLGFSGSVASDPLSPFAGCVTAGPGGSDVCALVDFLQGNLDGGRIATGNADRKTIQNSQALYFQDSFRWAKNFTVNFGLRWDYYGVIREDKDRFSTYDPVLGLVLVEDLYEADQNNFSPRLSFAWDLGGKGKTVLRAGIGTAYDAFSHDFFIGQIPFNCFNCPGVAYNPVLPDPLFLSLSRVSPLVVGQPVFEDPTDPLGGALFDTTEAFTVDPKLRTPYIYNFNLNLQQELWGGGVLQVGYVGSLGRKLFRHRDLNQPSLAEITAGDLACVAANPRLGNIIGGDDINQVSCNFAPRPFDNSASLSSVAPSVPYFVNYLEASARSNYHGLQMSFNQRNWRGLTQQISYTWSHSIDTASDGQDFVPNAAQPNDSRRAENDRGNSNFDTRHRFVWSATYDFPKWESLGWFGEGWQMSGVLTLLSGHPFNVNYFFTDDYDGSGEFIGRPDVIATPRIRQRDAFQFLDVSAFRVPCTLSDGDIDGDGIAETSDGSASFCVAGTRHFGNLGRNSLLGPNYRNFDFAVTKTTTLTERFKLHFRADVFNLTNHPNFASPLLPAFIADAAPNGLDPATGVSQGFLPIVATSDTGLGNPILGGGGPRSFQFAVKLIF